VMEIHGDGPISDSEMTLHRELIKLRSENSALRARIEVLEKAVEAIQDDIKGNQRWTFDIPDSIRAALDALKGK